MSNLKKILVRLASNRNFLITFVLAAGFSPVYLFPEYFFPDSDLTSQLYPFIFETKRMLSTGIPWWTWSSFLGDNFIGSYAYYTLTRPLLLAVCLLPYRYIGAGLVVSIYANFLILGWLTSCYLRMMGFDRKLRLIGSLFFTLSSYMICQLLYGMFFEPVQAFVIMLISIERLLRGRRFALATLSLAGFLVSFVNYYLMPATFIAGAIYFFCRIFGCYREHWLSLTLKAAACVCLGVMMAAVVLIPVMDYLSATPRLSQQEIINDRFYGYNWVVRALSLVAMPPHEGRLHLFNIDSGWNMNIAYVTIFGVLPYILYFIRRRCNWLTILCAIYIVCLVTPLNAVFSLFTHSYYSRWCYALVLMLLVSALGYFKTESGRTLPFRPTVIYCIISFCSLITVYCYAVGRRIYLRDYNFDNHWETYFAAFVLFVLNAMALVMLTRRPMLSRRWMLACIASFAVISIAQCLHVTYRYAATPLRKYDIPGTIQKMTASREESDTFVSRSYFEDAADVNIRRSNYNLFCNRPAIDSYISTINPVSAHLGFILQHDYYWESSIDRYHESAMALLSVKNFERYGDYPFVKVPETALRGDRYIPMGMAYDSYSLMEDSLADVERAKTHDILRGMLASLLIDKADEAELSRYMTPVEFRDSLPFDSLVAARRAYTCDSFSGDTHGFTATISLPDTMVVMFSTAADPGFTATIDGKPTKIYNVNMGMSASIVPAGRHTIRYEYFPPGIRAGALMSLAAILIFIGLVTYEWRNQRSRQPERIPDI